MKKKKYILLITVISLILTGCEDFLDRPPITNMNDETTWVNEKNIRLYANKFYPGFSIGSDFYPGFFMGYGSGWTNSYSPLLGYTFSDDVVHNGNQGNFTRAVPNSGVWSMVVIRSINIMMDRIENKMGNVLTEEEYAHWMGIGRFFRAMRYSELVLNYGDVPYYDHVVSDTDMDDLYKPRTPRNEVMDAVYDDLQYAFQNVRINDGEMNVNRYVVAGYISRIALHEGTWQKYYYKNSDRASKFLELAIEASDYVINSNKYDIVTEFRELFTSEDLKGNKDCIMYRHYDPAVGVTHSVASYNNVSESINYGPTTDLIKSFILNDGTVWQNSTMEGANNFELANVIKTRDPRFEGTFYDKPTSKNRGSYWYVNKFLPRSVAKSVEAGNAPPVEFTSINNRTDYPVLRYAEVLLNWIEAKAELGSSVTQDDLNKTINKIRNRPIAPEAVAMGVQKTAPLLLAELPDDPARDTDVSPLLWEIRRERRMEFAFEYSRIADLKRWYKLEYMDTDNNIDLLHGGWVNFPEEATGELTAGNAGKFSVLKLNGEAVTFNGGNNYDMIGFYRTSSTNGRQPFLNQVNINPYLSPIGRTQMDDYASKGYKLQQTEGWPQN